MRMRVNIVKSVVRFFDVRVCVCVCECVCVCVLPHINTYHGDSVTNEMAKLLPGIGESTFDRWPSLVQRAFPLRSELDRMYLYLGPPGSDLTDKM